MVNGAANYDGLRDSSVRKAKGYGWPTSSSLKF